MPRGRVTPRRGSKTRRGSKRPSEPAVDVSESATYADIFGLGILFIAFVLLITHLTNLVIG